MTGWKVLRWNKMPQIRAGQEQWYLTSPSWSHPWLVDGVTRAAECHCNPEHHTCGIYALNAPDSAELNTYASQAPQYTHVLVQLRPVGETVVGERGWRARGAEIIGAYVLSDEVAEHVRATYKRFPVIVVSEWPFTRAAELEAKENRSCRHRVKRVREVPDATWPLWEPRFDGAAKTPWQRWFVRSLFAPNGVCPWKTTRTSATSATKSMRAVFDRLAEMGVVVRRYAPPPAPLTKPQGRGNRDLRSISGEEEATYRAERVEPRPVEAVRPSYCHYHRFYNALKIVHPQIDEHVEAIMRAIDDLLYKLE